MTLRSFPSRFLFGLGLGIAIALLAAFNTLLIWVATGPRVLDQFTPYIEEALSAKDSSYRVQIGKTVLLWDGWRHPVSIRLHDVTLRTPKNEVFSQFPNIAMAVDIPYLMIGKIRPTSLTINEPVISLLQQDDYSISFGTAEIQADEQPAKQSANPSPVAIILEIFSRSNRRLSQLNILKIADGSISIGNAKQGVFFTANDTQISIHRTRDDALDVKATSDVTYGKRSTPLVASLLLENGGEEVRGGVSFENIIVPELEQMFAGSTHTAQLSMPIHGAVQFQALPEDNILKTLSFQIEGGQGNIEDERLDGTLVIDQFEARGELTDNLSALHIQQLNADLDGVTLQAEGKTTLIAPYIIQGQGSLKSADSKDVKLFWPPALAPISREWVLTNIGPAQVPEAKITVNIKPGDLDKELLPKEAVDAQVTVNNATIRYLPEHPPVTKLQGIVAIDGVSLHGNITQAHFLQNTQLSEGTVDIPDLMADNPRVHVGFHSDGPASDAVHVLELPRLQHAKHLGLKRSIEGKVTAQAKLDFDFYAPRDEEGNITGEGDINYNVTSKLTGITQKGILNKFDLQDVAGEIHVENGFLTIDANGTVNGADVSQASVKYLFTPEEGWDTFITAQAVAPAKVLPWFGYPDMPFLEGSIGVKAEVKQGPDKESSQAELDLTATKIMDNALSWTKEAGQPASLKLSTNKEGEDLVIPDFHLDGSGANIKGSATLNKELTDVVELELGSFTLGKNQINKLSLINKNNTPHLKLRAKTLDLTTYMQVDNSNFSFQNFPPIHLDAKIETLTLSSGHPIQSFNSTLHCNEQICLSADINGLIQDKRFELRITKNAAGVRELSAHVDNAGDFLRSVDIFDGMKNGLLTVSGNYNDVAGQPSTLDGRLVIGDFVLNDAPVLAKILSLASLTGFIDTLQGKGIAFKILDVPFTLHNDVITIKDSKAHGPAIGLTADGSITMPGIILDTSGTVVPSYTLNNSVSKVPLVGPLLTGGEDGGVFAARYSVRNSYKDPQVTVNPLSMLTPGFLRNLFEAFEGPPPDTKQ